MNMIVKASGLVMMVLVIATVLTTLNSIQINHLNEQETQLEDITNSIGGETVQISSRDQMRSLTAFNMLAASNCYVLYYVEDINENENYFDNMYRLHPDNDRTTDYEVDILGVEILDPDGEEEVELGGISSSDWHGVGSMALFDHGFSPLIDETDFSGTCAGASSALYEFEENAEEATETVVEGLNPIDQYDEFLSNMIVGEESRLEQPSQDMEGNFGEITFNVTEDFWLGDRESRGQLMAFKMFPRDIEQVDNDQGNYKIPPFYMGSRGAVFMPDNLEVDELNQENIALLNYEKDNPGNLLNPDNKDFENPERDFLYAFRPRIDTESRRLVVNNVREVWNATSDRERMRIILSNGKWRFCEGDRGNIQSNAGTITNSGEAEGTNSWREDSVFPEITLRREAENCLNSGVPRDDIEVGFADNSIRGDYCSINEARSGSFKKDVVLDERVTEEDLTMDYYCGLVPRFTPFNGDYDGTLDYYSPGLYADTSMCTEPPSEDSVNSREVNLLDQDSSEPANLNTVGEDPDNDGDRSRGQADDEVTSEFTEVAGSDAIYMTGLSQSSYGQVSWSVEEYDGFTFETTIDVSNELTDDSDSNGEIIFKINDQVIALYDKNGPGNTDNGDSYLISGDSSVRVPDSNDQGNIVFEVDEDGEGSIQHTGSGENPSLSFDSELPDNFSPGHPREIEVEIKGEDTGDNYDISATVTRAEIKNFQAAGCNYE